MQRSVIWFGILTMFFYFKDLPNGFNRYLSNTKHTHSSQRFYWFRCFFNTKNMMQFMTSYEEVYVSQRALVSSLKYSMSQDSVSQELEAEMFRCLNLQKPHMCDKKVVCEPFQTFSMIRKVQRRMNWLTLDFIV